MKTTLIYLLTTLCMSPVLSLGEIKFNQAQVEHALDDLYLPNGPGIQYVVVDKNSVVFAQSSGLADIKSNTPLSLDHTMAAFSITKTLTAIAILQLLERGKIKLNDKASQYISHPYNPAITIKQLLIHTSGIPNPIPLKWAHLASNHHDFDEKKALAEVLTQHSKSHALPGEKYKYSNIGYWLLGGIIEKVSGQKYSDYIMQNIFQPLNLNQQEIGFEINDVTNHAKAYLKKYSFVNLFKSFVMDKEIWGEYEGKWLNINNIYLNGPAFGGVIGSAMAFSRILQDLLMEKSVLLSNNIKQLLYLQQTTKSGESIDMTLAWHIGELNGIKNFYKQGGGAGFRSEMRVYPSLGLATIIMTNRTSYNTKKYLNMLDSHFSNL